MCLSECHSIFEDQQGEAVPKTQISEELSVDLLMQFNMKQAYSINRNAFKMVKEPL